MEDGGGDDGGGGGDDDAAAAACSACSENSPTPFGQLARCEEEAGDVQSGQASRSSIRVSRERGG